MTTRLQDTIDLDAPPGTGDAAVLHRAVRFFIRQHFGGPGGPGLPLAPNLGELRKLLPVLDGFAKTMLICAAGDGELAPAELEWILGFSASAGATAELLDELRSVDPRTLDPRQLLQQTERPEQFIHALVYQAIQAADADGTLEPGEIQTIRAMALLLGLPASDVDALVTLYRDEQAFLERKRAALFPHGHPWG